MHMCSRLSLKGWWFPNRYTDKVDNGCLITVRVANHNAEDANVTLKSVVDGNEVSTQVAVKAKSEQWVKMQNKDVKSFDDMSCKFYFNDNLTYENEFKK